MHPDAGTPPGGRRLRVLIVEDYDDAAESLAMLLDLWGFDPRRCRTVREASAAFEGYRPHAVLLDLHLPDGDGVELARAFLTRDPRLLVVVISGTATDADRQRCADAGIQHFLAKPSDPATLHHLLLTKSPRPVP